MTEGLRVLVADDERPARAKLRRFLNDSPSVSVIFEATNGAKAIEVVQSEHPDVVFLDINMPGVDGLAAAESITGQEGPYVVFVTAHDEHAVHAFELGAVDYLLKPFDRERFDAALARIETAVSGERNVADVRDLKKTLHLLASSPALVERLMVEDGDRSRILALSEVVRFESDKNYVRVFALRGEFRLRTTMTKLEHRLPNDQFARINRSQIVNLDCVRDLAPAGHGDHDVRMTDGSTVRLSRRYRDRVKGWT